MSDWISNITTDYVTDSRGEAREKKIAAKRQVQKLIEAAMLKAIQAGLLFTVEIKHTPSKGMSPHAVETNFRDIRP